MKVSLHNHTYRCRHAEGTEREYIERALENGIEVIGFSDHAPFMFPDGVESGYRVPVASAKEYVETLRTLREEYKERIKIEIGFEMEYYPLYFKDMLKGVVDAGAEYLILGQHYIRNEIPEKRQVMLRDNIGNDDLVEFVEEVSAAIRTGVFTYIAHPDVINFKGDSDLYLPEMKKICIEAKKYSVPLELNLLGIRSGRHYPNEKFWEMVGEIGCDVVYGFDAHDAMNAYDGESLIIAEKMRRKYNLNVIEYPNIVYINK